MAGSGVTQVDVTVEGLRETRAALRRSEQVVKKEINNRLKTVGDIVAVEAQAIARSKFQSRSGKLLRSIRPRARSMGVAVVASVKRRSAAYPKGYNYPKRLEYENNGARAFMRPALDNKREEAVSELAKVLDEISREFGAN